MVKELEILEKSGILTRKDNCTHIEIPFLVKQQLDTLVILIEYTPKQLEDKEEAMFLLEEMKINYLLSEQEELAKRFEANLPLNNLITLSVDDPKGFRGAGHRHPARQLVRLEEKMATVGYIKGAILEGTWRLILTVHALVTEECQYFISVKGEINEKMASL